MVNNLTTTSMLDLPPNSVIVLYANTSDLPPQKANEYLTEVVQTDEVATLAAIATSLGHKVICMPSTIQVQVLSFGPNDRAMITVDLANMPPNRAEEFLVSIKERFEQSLSGIPKIITGTNVTIKSEPIPHD